MTTIIIQTKRCMFCQNLSCTAVYQSLKAEWTVAITAYLHAISCVSAYQFITPRFPESPRWSATTVTSVTVTSLPYTSCYHRPPPHLQSLSTQPQLITRDMDTSFCGLYPCQNSSCKEYYWFT
ncbi:hypothetical protein J6590_006120 [Homalodisca vitripennis]|nr:hypothetical protein J6590_006120 [Homalodisca vitripennis]